MGKYIIDTKTWANLFEVQKVGVYGIGNDIVTDEKTVWSRMFRLDELEELNSDYINENYGNLQDDAYKRGFEDGNKSGYEKGLNAVGTYRKGYTICYDDGYEDGKKSIDKGCEGCRYVLKFANDDPCKNCSNCYTSKYAPMPKQDESIKVGDEVINNTTGTKGILLEPETEDLLATVVVPNNRWNTFNMSHINLTKTGHHFDIQSILDAMKQ